MKIKTVQMDYDDVIKLTQEKKFTPKKPNIFFRKLMKVASSFDLSAVNFSYSKQDMDRLTKNEPCLYLMNHSSFIDLKIASTILYPRKFNIVCTSDGFVGKKWLMRNLGCIPTKKFISEPSLLSNMMFCFNKLHTSVLMYPEASYTFDGTATPLPESLGKCLKLFKVPVVMIKTYGAFARDPLYNNLRLRNVKVSAELKYLLSPEDIEKKSTDELNSILKDEFIFDNFRWQADNKIRISEDFRADGINRVLYKCPHCNSEKDMAGKGTKLVCNNCGKTYELNEYGMMQADNGVTEFPHIPDWYAWERECVKQEILNGDYKIETPVTVRMMVDFRKIYEVGKGVLTHSSAGFHLVACDGKIDFIKTPISSYSLYADYNWYEIGDIICIGDTKTLYYCFPEGKGDIVAKARIATEELYKLEKNQRRVSNAK